MDGAEVTSPVTVLVDSRVGCYCDVAGCVYDNPTGVRITVDGEDAASCDPPSCEALGMRTFELDLGVGQHEIRARTGYQFFGGWSDTITVNVIPASDSAGGTSAAGTDAGSATAGTDDGKDSGCGCRATDRRSGAPLLMLAGALCVRRRRR